MAIRGARCAACLLSGALAACGGGGGSHSSSGSSGPHVTFAVASQSVVETVGSASVTVVLDRTSVHTIVVPFSSSGTAVAGTHYVLGATEARFDPGASDAELSIDVLAALALFEPDVELVLALGVPENAELGAIVEHRLAIRNDDLFAEIEPNEAIAQANDVGGEIGVGRSGTIEGAVQGAATSDQFDVFLVRALEDVSVELLLEPESVSADVSLWVSDPTGALTDLFEAGGPGASEGGTIEVAAGESFYLVALTLTDPTAYALSVDGASSLVIRDPRASGSGDPLMDLGDDWPAIARALLARKLGVAQRVRRVEGFGVWIDRSQARAGTFVLER